MQSSVLTKRLSLYFKYHVAVRMRLTPSPTNAKEVQHLYYSFKKLPGQIDYFHLGRGEKGLNQFGRDLTVVLAPTKFSLLQPFSEDEMGVEIKEEELQASKDSLFNYFTDICGLPRYSYIEGSKSFLEGKIKIPFKFSLSRHGLKYAGRYKVSSSTIEKPFAHIVPTGPEQETGLKNDSTFEDFRRQIRHNFQKFHKFDNVVIETGPEFINSLSGSEKLSSNVNSGGQMNYSEISNLYSRAFK